MIEAAGVEALYALPPEQFIAARGALAKEIRAGGDRAEAARVAKLRRPPVSAWALNQVAKADPRLVKELLDAGGVLRTAMSDAMAGDASSLRTAETAERETVEAIVGAAAAHLDGQGRSLGDLHRQRMTATLRAAVLDEEVAASLRRGTLDSDHDAPPFGFGAVPEVASRNTSATDGHRVRPDPASMARERARRAERGRMEAEAERLRRRAERLEEDAVDAERRAAELRAKAAQAAAAAAAVMAKLAETGS
jgi:hypothetical protein